MPIVPKHDGDREDFRQKPIGTGPYKLVSWTRDDRMILEANEDYWQGKPIIPNVVFRPIPENATRLLAFEAGEIDVFQGGVVPQEIDRLEADPNYIVQRVTGTGYNYLGFNTQVGSLSDVRVRQALSYVINREWSVSSVDTDDDFTGCKIQCPQSLNQQLSRGVLLVNRYCILQIQDYAVRTKNRSVQNHAGVVAWNKKHAPT